MKHPALMLKHQQFCNVKSVEYQSLNYVKQPAYWCYASCRYALLFSLISGATGNLLLLNV